MDDNRFVDKLSSETRKGDFVRRQDSPSLLQILLVFSLAIAVCFSLISQSEFLGGNFSVGILITIILGCLGLYFYLMIHKAHDVIMASEYQNSIFAGSSGAGFEFSLIINNEGNIIYFNPGYYKYFPYSATNNKNFSSTIKNWKLDEAQINNLNNAVLKSVPTRGAVELTDLEGTQRKLNLLIEPIKRPRGYVSLKAIKTDYLPISNEEIETNALEKNTFSEIFDSIDEAAYLLWKDGTIQYCNKAFLNVFGFSNQEIYSNKFRIENFLFNATTSNFSLLKPFSGELTFSDKEQKMFKAEVSHHVIKNHKDVVIKSYGIISPREIGGQPVKKVSSTDIIEQGWEALIEEAPIAKAMLDEKGIILKSNSAFRILSEHKNNASLNIIDIVSAESREEVSKLLKEAVFGKNTNKKPVAVTINNNENVTANLFIGHAAKIKGAKQLYLAHLIDTTEQKSLEQRFVHSQKMQAVGQLAGGIAHDFNNLLTAMIGFCDLLLIKHPPGDQSFPDIMQVKQNANRAANLVRQLLAFSRKQTLHPEIINITDVLAELSNLIRRLIGENIELKINHGSSLGLVKVDQGQLEQVIINLAVNARDAMNGGGLLTIQTSNVNIGQNFALSKDYIPPAEDEVITPGEYVLIEVIDTGNGITKEIITKIFEPFFSTKEVGQGTGLGLATVYGIVKQTGGYIYVLSHVGKGTNFSIFLKRYHSEAGAKISAKPEEKIDTKEDLTGAETILLVEDEDPVRAFSARALRNKGYNVIEADCGEAAIDIVRKQGAELDMIITDVVMPGITGPAMIEEVLKIHPKIKVIFISGYAEDAFVKTYGSERKFNFLPKPFTLKQLASKVKEVVEKEK